MPGRTRRRAWIVCALLAAMAPASAQEPEVIVIDPNRPLIQDPGTVRPAPGAVPAEIPPPAPTPGVNAREVLADLWFRHRALVSRGETQEAARQVTAVLDFMKREGLRAAPEIAAAFQSEARRALDEGDYRAARDRFGIAARFDPAFPAPHFGMAAALLRGDRDVRGAAREMAAGFRTWLRDPAGLYDVAANAAVILFVGMCAGAAAALMLLCLRAAPAFFHDLKERSGGRLSDESARLLGWAILSLPWIALLPLVWLLAAWAALFFTYLRRSERLVGAGALLLFALAGPAARVVDWAFGTAADPAARALVESLRGGSDPGREQALRKLADEYPADPMFPFLLASLRHAGGRADDALSLYRRVLEIEPGHVRAMINLANLHTLRQEFALAQGLYRRAAELAPTLALPHYNSHLAHLEAFHLESADEELKIARRLDDALVTDLLARGAEGRARRSPENASYAPAEVWKRALLLRFDRGLRQEWARALGTPATLAGGIGLVGALMLPGIGLAPRRSPARRCRRCGRAFCRRCQVATKYPDHCSQCMHLFILRDGLAPGIKSQKMDEVMRHRRRVWVGERLLSLLLPGSGHVLGGRAVRGALILGGWATAWVGLALSGRLLVAPLWIAPATGAAALLPPILLALVVWLAGNLTSHEVE